MFEKIKKYFPYILPALAVGIGFALFNHFFPQERVVEKEVYKEDKRITELLSMVESMKTEISRVKTAQVNEKYRKWEHEETKPDGSKTRDAGEERNIDSVVTETEKVVEVKVVEVEKQVVVVQTVEKVTEKIREPVLKNWRVSPMVGVGFDIKGGPQYNGVVYGAEAERRILGPIWLGVWGVGNTQIGGVAGIKASIEF